MNEKTLDLFKQLTELQAAPGNEQLMRAFMKERLKPYADEIIQDKLGGIFGVKKGKGPKVMAAGHMDEVGFMVTGITPNGLLRFQTLGGWWSQVLLAQRVQVMTDEGPIPGVISSTPPHLLTPEQRSKPASIDSMLIDIGADDERDAYELGVKLGQQILPFMPFTPMANEKKILAKAWDNRYGCGLALELMEEVAGETLPNQLYAGATVQEEVGLRGAQVAANMIKPDIFYAMDASPANDVSGDKQVFGHLGQGALLRIFDGTMIMNRNMREFILDTAESNNINYQYYVGKGGTDAGRVHLAHEGVPSAVIGIVSRYVHTSASIIHVDDYAAAKELLIKLVRATDQSTVDLITSND
ncbi:M42 family metallopeptidase [Terribacillus saccharophilus]|uniref:Peptidase M28 n=1 Tax=Terribacillus saccharophilus TaxID=361277 RepID=A0ABX4GU61_9BACI|nr:M42 family metallopeptidase [Terribacillus saccharophilus]PAD33935.1 peptidase M28 [Terribacillus saccharophilus]PAD94637.1 peptidase M28 [Terribacillus saccharophilus]PAD98399.1 peptidase M28 [Terribacillus saccharophilus]